MTMIEVTILFRNGRDMSSRLRVSSLSDFVKDYDVAIFNNAKYFHWENENEVSRISLNDISFITFKVL